MLLPPAPVADAAPAPQSDGVAVRPGADVVVRPDPGIARGVWEAPRGAFFVALALVLLLSALYAAHRTGRLRLPRSKDPRP